MAFLTNKSIFTFSEEQDNIKMQEVKRGVEDSKHKEDKMVELKEAITQEIQNILFRIQNQKSIHMV